jgi:hypothetical protein
MAQILAIEESKNHFDKNIRTIRLNIDHFERIESEESFQSELYSENEDKRKNIKDKIEGMK